jgi:hypothetical protein
MTNPTEQLETITVMIAKARDAVYNGSVIDMTEILGLVQEVCEAIQQTPPTDGKEAHDSIININMDLNLLVEELKAQQKQIQDESIKKIKNQANT